MLAPKLNIFKDEELLEDETALAEETASTSADNGGEGQSAAAAAEATEASTAGTGATTTEEKPHEKTVSYERFKEINDKFRQTEKEAQELREYKARIDERSKVLREAQDQITQQAERDKQAAQRPDPAVDPVGAQLFDVTQALAQERAARESLQTQLQQFGQNLNQNQEQSQFSNWVQAEVQQYARSDPQYLEKARFAAEKRIGFWQGVGAPPDVARKMVEAESVLIARIAQQYGGKFPQLVAQLADNWGYKPAGGNGTAGATQVSPAAQRLAQVAAGQRAQGLSAIPGTGQAEAGKYANYSPADLAQMSEAEWNRVRRSPEAMRQLAVAVGRAEGIEPAEAMTILRDR